MTWFTRLLGDVSDRCYVVSRDMCVVFGADNKLCGVGCTLRGLTLMCSVSCTPMCVNMICKHHTHITVHPKNGTLRC
jgi:hypothetical protein